MRPADRLCYLTRCAAASACLILLAQPLDGSAQDAEQAESQLDEIEGAIREREAREKGLDGEVEDVSGEVDDIRRDLIDAAAVVQDQETQLDQTEREIADLDRRYAERQAAFETHRAELERTLAALALFARSPPQALIARPGDWADTVRGLTLLDEAIPSLKQSADAAAAEASALAALRDARARRQTELAEESTSLDRMRADLRRLLERKSSLHATLMAERRRIGIEIASLGAEATDTRDLIDRLEMARAEAATRQADEAAARAAQPVPSPGSGTLRADDLIAGAAPPLPEAPAEPLAAAGSPSPSPDGPELGTAGSESEAASRLAIVTPSSPTTPTASPAVATAPSSDLAEPELGTIEADAGAAPRLASITPLAPDAPTAPPDAAPAAALSELAKLDPAFVEPDADVSTRLAALPVAPPPVKSSLPYPAHGDVIAKFNARVEGGQKSLGASIRTRERAQVVAPRRGEVVFAGPFRGFGQLLILEHDGGYHSLLSGFSRLDAQVGQQVLAGEPVGVMGIVAESATILYIEIRRNRQPIDPIPWLLAGDRKVSG